MFDEIRFNTIERLPNYVFAEVNAIKMAARRAGEDIIDFSMGNPEGRTPQHIVDKLCESAQKDNICVTFIRKQERRKKIIELILE